MGAGGKDKLCTCTIYLLEGNFQGASTGGTRRLTRMVILHQYIIRTRLFLYRDVSETYIYAVMVSGGVEQGTDEWSHLEAIMWEVHGGQVYCCRHCRDEVAELSLMMS